jgi:hypothetical protein
LCKWQAPVRATNTPTFDFVPIRFLNYPNIFTAVSWVVQPRQKLRQLAAQMLLSRQLTVEKTMMLRS